MGTKRGTYTSEIKALGDATGDAGRVEALVSIFGNVDLVGDRVMPGAFARSIQEWKASGDPVPVVFSHEWGDLWSHIGVVDDLQETPKGLLATYTLDIADNPAAAQVFKLLKRRSLKEHSFAYDVVNEHRADDGANELIELKIIELGPTLKGANADTELLTVKSILEAGSAKAQSDALGDLAHYLHLLETERDEIAEEIDSWLVSTSAADKSGQVGHVRLLATTAKSDYSEALDVLRTHLNRKSIPGADALFSVVRDLIDAGRHSRSALAMMHDAQAKSVRDSNALKARIEAFRGGAPAYNVNDPASLREHIASLRAGSDA